MAYQKSLNYTVFLSGKSVATSSDGTSSTNTYNTMVTVSQSKKGESKPNWGVIIAGGGNATTNYDALWVKRTGSQPTSARVDWANGRSLVYSGDRFTHQSFLGNPDLAILRSEEQAIHSGASSTRAGFSGGTFLGELKESLQMLKHPANSLRKLTEESHKKRVYRRQWFEQKPTRQRYRDAMKSLTDLHLEFQFGWKPLASDVQSAIEAIQRSGNVSHRMRIRGGGEENIQDPETRIASYNVGDVNTPLGVFVKGNTYAKSSIKGTAALKLGFGMPAFQHGTTIPDFIPTMWNLMPWSFLFDYFGNIGSVLETQAFAQLTKVNWASLGSVAVGTYTVSNRFYTTYDTGQRVSTTGPTGSHEYVTVKRRLITTYPIPSFTANKTLSTMRGLNIAALVNGKLQDWIWKGKNMSLIPKRK